MSMCAADFSVLSKIRDSCYGHVLKIAMKSGIDKGKVYACKTIKFKDKNAIHNYRKEIEFMNNLKNAKQDHYSPFLMPLSYHFCQESVGFLVFPLAMGDLMDLLMVINRLLRPTEALFYVMEVILALEYLHTLSIVHLDVKMENVLVAQDGHCLLTDFDRSFDLKETPKRDDFQGTLVNMAPEVMRQEKICTASDIFSLGVLAMTLVSGSPNDVTQDASLDDNDLISEHYKILSSRAHNLPRDDYSALVKSMLQMNESDRPSCNQLKSFPVFKSINWSTVLNKTLAPPFVPKKPFHNS